MVIHLLLDDSQPRHQIHTVIFGTKLLIQILHKIYLFTKVY